MGGHPGHCEVAKLLLEKSAQIDLQKNDGGSALMSASIEGHSEVVKLLLENGACAWKKVMGGQP